jgi:hypothetical protein
MFLDGPKPTRDGAFKSYRLSQMKPGRKMKAPKAENTPPAELKVWCESCCLRVAPNEERTAVHGKTYHSRCYSKLNSKQKK